MRKHFTIRQVCECCEVSRATVLRMEKRGLLQPVFVDPNTGYRYYDANNISRILHIRMFLDMGMSYDDAALYFQSGGQSRELLRSLRERLDALQQTYDAMELRISSRRDREAEIVRLPEYICYQKEYPASFPGGRHQAARETFREALEQGCRPQISKHIFIVNKREDLRTDADKGEETRCDYTCCIPLRQSCAEQAHTAVYPACTAFSLLCYGDFSAIGEAHQELGRRIRELGLKPTGYPRSIAIVSGYTDESFSQQNYVFRLAVPIEPPCGEELSGLTQRL